MRRLAGILVLTLLLAVPAVTAVATNPSYADDFSQGGYTGNSGSPDLEFSGPWQEWGDNGTPSSGRLHVGNENCEFEPCLHLEGEGLIPTTFYIERSADLSIFNQATLRFDIHVVPEVGDTAILKVKAWNGSSWATLKSYNLALAKEESNNLPLKSYLCTQEFALRFEISGSLLHNGYVTIDNVQLTGSLSSTTTTTTTTTSTTTTTTSASSTTTTSAPTTTSTSSTTTTTSPTTTTTEPTTTSTEPHRTTTTTRAPTTTSTLVTTTSTSPTSTTTTLAAIVIGEDTTPSPPEFEAGIHDMGEGKGLMYDIHEGMNGDLSGLDDVEVLSAAVTADFSLAVEAFKSTKVWLAALSLMIAAALVSGMDHRRRVRGEFATLSANQPVVEG